MTKRLRTALIWFGLVLVFLILFTLGKDDKPGARESFESFLRHVREDRVASIRVNNNEIYVTLRDGEPSYTTLGVVDDETTQLVSDHGGIVTWGEPPRRMRAILIILLPIALIVVFLWYFAKKASTAQTGIFSLSKSRAREVTEDRDVTFDDVAGCEEAKLLLGDVVDYLSHPERWTDAGARLPRGVLLEGPPGCGKTLLARAVAGETKATFYTVSATEFVELVVGVGAGRVRDMFDTASKNAPAVVFIDELDAVGRRRGSGIGFGHDEREQTLNQILVSLDGFERTETLVVIAATNRSDVLDPALLRPGRFDRRIVVPALSLEARERAWEIHTRNKPLTDDVSLFALAELTAGYTGAELESAANEAAMLAIRRVRKATDDQVAITQADFVDALRPIRAGRPEYDNLETLLIESVGHVTRPAGDAIAQISVRGADDVIGQIVWADSAFIKLRNLDDEDETTIIAKRLIESIRVLPGTEHVRVEDLPTFARPLEVPGAV